MDRDDSVAVIAVENVDAENAAAQSLGSGRNLDLGPLYLRKDSQQAATVEPADGEILEELSGRRERVVGNRADVTAIQVQDRQRFQDVADVRGLEGQFEFRRSIDASFPFEESDTVLVEHDLANPKSLVHVPMIAE